MSSGNKPNTPDPNQASEASKNGSQSRKLAAILFADIEGYSAMMNTDEQDGLRKLAHFQSTLAHLLQRFNGQQVKDLGDGSLCVFSSAVEAVHCAKELQIILRSDPKVPVRIGMHLGDIVFESNNVFGDGVNIASRIESMGVPGCVFFSENIYNVVRSQKELTIKSLGQFDLKNIADAVTVYALANEGFPVPLKSKIVGKFKEKKSGLNLKQLALIIALLAAIIFIYFQNTNNQPSNSNLSLAVAGIPNSSIAILPFDNLSADKENDYFSEGIHDDLLTHVSMMSDMKVISRTSVLQYKDNKPPLPEIALALGVAHIMEGSVRKSGNQVRINVQLIKAATDDHLWSEIYDRELTSSNLFEIQTEIAKEIALALKANISPDLEMAMNEKPTENIEAYQDYLKGRQLLEAGTPKSITEAKTHLENAIEKDPEFALAYVMLGEVHYMLPEYTSADSKSNYKIAWKYLDKAKSINDHLAEAYTLESSLYHRDVGDIKGATTAYEKSIAINPNNANSHTRFAKAVLEMEGDAAKAMKINDNAIRLDPLSPNVLNLQGQFQVEVGEIDKAKQTYNKVIRIAPEYGELTENMSVMFKTHFGQFDSATINSQRAFSSNKEKTEFYSNYVDNLAELGMFDEMDTEIEMFRPEDLGDSLKLLRSAGKRSMLKNDFEEAIKTLSEIKKIDKDVSPLEEFNFRYLKRDFSEAVDIYEGVYPNALRGRHLDDFMQAGRNQKIKLLDEFQKYIYSLYRIGNNQKADLLLENFGNRIALSGSRELSQSKKKRSFFKIRDYLIKGEVDLALNHFATYFDGKLAPEWQYELMDPIFDIVRDDPRFLKIEKDMRATAARQRENVRSHMKGNN